METNIFSILGNYSNCNYEIINVTDTEVIVDVVEVIQCPTCGHISTRRLGTRHIPRSKYDASIRRIKETFKQLLS